MGKDKVANKRWYYGWKKRDPEGWFKKKREDGLRYNFGMTLDDFDRMLIAQDGKCAICKTDKPGGRGRFHVDHNHETGKIRALLCQSCNLRLGTIEKAQASGFFDAAMRYLEDYNG